MEFNFVGITISNNINPELLQEFDGSCVSYKYFNNRYCLFYTGKPSGLENFEFHRFINELKKVESDELYDNYNDNMGYHCLKENKKKIIIRKKIIT